MPATGSFVVENRDDAYSALVVEDNPTFRQQITGALAQAGAGQVTAFATGEETLAHLATLTGDRLGLAPLGLVLVDIGLPDMSGIDVIRQIRARFAELPILVISVIKSEETLLDAIRAGARGYILKTESEEAIAHAIREVRGGNYPISPALARSLFRLASAPEASPLAHAPASGGASGGASAGASGGAAATGTADGARVSAQAYAGVAFQLTPREREVLHLIARGLSYLEVAAELVVSLSTIQTYVRGLYRKLEVHNRQAAVNKGRAAGVL